MFGKQANILNVQTNLLSNKPSSSVVQGEEDSYSPGGKLFC